MRFPKINRSLETILAISREMQKKRKHIDTADLMVEINHIINENIEMEHTDEEGLVQSISVEQQRYVREGFSSDEELSIYGLLFSENLPKADTTKIKRISIDLLQKTKERIAQMDH